MKLTMLPAGEGDALWLRWYSGNERHQILVDLGVHATGRALRTAVERLPLSERKFDLLVVTHVDTDHIYGILSAFVDEPIEGLEFGDIWFNGWTHLAGGTVNALTKGAPDSVLGKNDLEAYGGVQGEQFSHWLRARPWNRAFGGRPVLKPDSGLGPPQELPGGLRITVLGPTRERLANLAPKWGKEVKKALEQGRLDPDEISPALASHGLEPMGREQEEPVLEGADDLEALAATRTKDDTAVANGSSICLLLELEGKRLVLAGDAFADDLTDALRTLQTNDTPPRIDAFKLPHHGSQKNVTAELVNAVHCKNWLISTNGVKHKHPDPVAIARIIYHATPRMPVLWFNEPSTYNSWWNRQDWRTKFGYETCYGAAGEGIEIEL